MTETELPPAIRIRDLDKSYAAVSLSARKALDGLSVEVAQGRFFGFLGPNGAGKTTTIKILMGVAEPDSGVVEVLGMRMPEQSLEIRRHLGLVPEDTLLFDYLTGSEYLEFVGRMYGLPRHDAQERARDLLGLFELSDTGRKLLGEYSKGMRKRVAMASALIHRPRLFLLDEPFEGVDAVGARLMKDILLDQARRGATIFITSHVLEVVERLCDEIAIVNQGRVVAQGTVSNLARDTGVSTLEEVFVKLVGAEAHAAPLEWL